jgi:hypothetical protein
VPQFISDRVMGILDEHLSGVSVEFVVRYGGPGNSDVGGTGSSMTANELFAKMEGRFGKYRDCGVVCSNREDIKNVVCEIDWYTLYHVMTDRNALYVVHHPVSDFALRLSEINPEEEQDDIRSEAQNWLLEFRARELRMNLAVAHTMADKMLEGELSEWLEGAEGQQVVTRINGFFDRFFDPHPAIVILPAARRLLDQGAPAKVVLGTYGYEAKEGMIYVDQCGMEETDQAITIPHSLVDVAAMILWRAAAMSSISES